MSASGQGVTPPAQEKPEKKANPVWEQWRVTILKVRPRLIGLTLLTIGIILGLAWGYMVAPVIWQDSDPVHLHASHQQEWVKMVADQYALFGPQIQEHATDMLGRVGNAQAIIDGLIASSTDQEFIGRLQAIRAIAPGADNPELAKVQYSGLQTWNVGILVGVIFIVGVIVIIFIGMYGMMIGMIVRGLIPSRRGGTEEQSEGAKREAERRRIAAEMKAEMEAAPIPAAPVAAPISSPFTASAPGGAPSISQNIDTMSASTVPSPSISPAAPPVAAPAAPTKPPLKRFPSTYLTGDDYYDDSFSIEDDDGGFLGETGAGISETIGVGAPKKVTAVEVWLFDKNDIRTVTKVIMSEHAYNDPAIRAKLAPKGEAVMAELGKPVELETQTLRIIATIRGMKYGEGPMPTNSFFDNITLDIAAYPKEGATSAPGTALGNMYDTGSSTPPPPPGM